LHRYRAPRSIFSKHDGRLEELNLAHIDGVLNAQRVLNPTDLFSVSRMSSH